MAGLKTKATQLEEILEGKAEQPQSPGRVCCADQQYREATITDGFCTSVKHAAPLQICAELRRFSEETSR